MALEVTNLKRKFILKKGSKTETLVDPNPEFTADEVMKHYSSKYPELTTSTIDGPKVEGDEAIYEFKTTVGTKG